MFLSTVMDHVLNLPLSPFIKWTRLTLTGIAILSGITLGVVFVPYPFVGSVMEMVAVATMTAYFCTFAYKLEKVESPIITEFAYIERVADSQSVARRRVV